MMIKPKKLVIACGLALLPYAMIGVNIASASEITGTINSDGTVTISTTTGTLQGSVGQNSSGNISGTVVGGSQASGTLGGDVGSGGTISGTVTGGTSSGGGGGGGGGGVGGNGPIITTTNNNTGGVVLGTTTTNNPSGGMVLGQSTSSPQFPVTGFGPNNFLLQLLVLGLIVGLPLAYFSPYFSKRRRKFMESRRINEFSIDESIFSQ